ncbi:class I SAM-dependent methyltransferase [Streptomyces macrosporus]|uniref:Class I SAM-dependent methyltransferase n=1 Tax=Streptomyces macrosporus TaxID=44032 RepID=A0ABN3KAX8_9ACTN
MADRLFTDPSLAALYDVICAERSDFDDFYLPLVMSARSVLDVGCGTGQLLRRAREAGHPGRLCGLDPAEAMLARARRRTDVAWVLGDLSTTAWEREFDLIVMTGHAFQVLLGDDELRTALAAVRTALADDGRFVFETRNPAARAWETWTPENGFEVVAEDGSPVRYWVETDTPVEGDTVRFAQFYAHPRWEEPKVSRSTLRFLDVDPLDAFLTEAGLTVEERFGDWDRSPLTAHSPEIVTVAARSDRHGDG